MSESRDLDQWRPCAPGMLQEMAEGEHRRQRRQMLLRVGGGAGALLMATAAGWEIARSVNSLDPVYGGIACSRVSALARDFLNGRVAPHIREQIVRHLQECPRCRQMIESIANDAAPQVSQAVPCATDRVQAVGGREISMGRTSRHRQLIEGLHPGGVKGDRALGGSTGSV